MREVRRTVIEALILTVVGLVLGLSINAVNEDGVTLLRQNFPTRVPITPRLPATNPVSTTGPAATQASTSAPSNGAENKLASEGIGIAHYNDVKAMLADPLFNTTLFLVDARDDEHYTAGHIANAIQVDHYHLDRYLTPQLLQLLVPAQKVIVYCNGGECEDSEMTSVELIQHGVPAANLFVYTGGYQDWISRHEPLEKGERGSGNIIPAPGH